MKTLTGYSDYGNDLNLTRQDAVNGSHRGDCENDVKTICKKRYVKKQIDKFNPIQLAKELKDCGAWDSDELQNHSQNVIKWVWMCCSDINDRL